ncbi:MAG: endo-1,4-beta-xylanase [Defluviitaleaceae bacterium]|nr:endo-1,4-beta-xylanase [Defluviitaleaceae bacterium]
MKAKKSVSKRYPIVFALIFAIILSSLPIHFPVYAAPVQTPVSASDLFVGFEDGTTGGFVPRRGTESLTVTNATAHSGQYSLLISRRLRMDYGAQIDVTQYVEPDTIYEVTFWVRQRTAGTHNYGLFTELVPKGSATGWMSAFYINNRPVSQRDGWVKVSGMFFYDSTLYELDAVTIFLQADNAGTEYYIDSVSFVKSDANQNLLDSARLPSLHETYRDHFKVGNYFDLFYPLNMPGIFIPHVARHYNIMSAGGGMTPRALSPERGVYNFAPADAIIDTLRSEGIEIVGHTLLSGWGFEHSPEWMSNRPDGAPLTRTQAIANLTEYINAVMKHYSGRVPVWHVINEAIGYAGPNCTWRDAIKQTAEHGAHWYLAFDNGANRSRGESGADFVEYAFRIARAADPGAILYYNECFEDNPNTARVVAEMVKEINDKWLSEGNTRLLIEGIGMQAHYNLNTVVANVENAIRTYANIGVSVSITELDVLIFDRGTTGVLTQTLLERQARKYAELFAVFQRHSKHIHRVIFCNLDDGTSWLNYYHKDGGICQIGENYGYPLIFDNLYNPKLAYFAVIDPAGYLAGNFRTEAQRQAWIRANSLPVFVELTLDEKLFGTWDRLGTVQSLANFTQRNQHNVNTWMQDIMRRRGDNRQQLDFTDKGRIIANGVTGFGDTWTDASIGGRSYEIRTIGGNDYLFVDNRMPGSGANASWTVFVRG